MTMLAVQLYTDPCYGTGECAPPHNATRIQRDAWTVELDPSTVAIFGEQTGIRVADSLIEWSRSLLDVERGIRVWSPDLPVGDQSRWSVTDSSANGDSAQVVRP